MVKNPAIFKLAMERSTNIRLREVLGEWFGGSTKYEISDSRGLAMLEVSDDQCKRLEWDDDLKSYSEKNFFFGDLLAPIRPRWPILFFMSRQNPAGVGFEEIGKEFTIIHLGPAYSFPNVMAALSYALKQQEIQTHPFILNILSRNGLNPDDPSFSSFWTKGKI